MSVGIPWASEKLRQVIRDEAREEEEARTEQGLKRLQAAGEGLQRVEEEALRIVERWELDNVR